VTEKGLCCRHPSSYFNALGGASSRTDEAAGVLRNSRLLRVFRPEKNLIGSSNKGIFEVFTLLKSFKVMMGADAPIPP
jgi:hypothetical protein